jgi:dihydrofolate synthase/folylpolyglutamate synthase
MIPTFWQFLEEKPLYFDLIDHQRVHQAYKLIRDHISHPRLIHIIGTNGKGSTGRMIAYLAYRGGLRTGHFSSPHIMKFNERIWLNGSDSSDEELETAHRKLYSILGVEVSYGLSYFEYTTLLALVLFEDVDLVVLEAGLGGEYDATNIVEKALSVITPIGIDHQAFLGDSIAQIAGTKIRSIQKLALIAPQPYHEAVEAAYRIAEVKGARLVELQVPSDNDTAQRRHALEQIASSKGWGGFLVDNAMVALKALDLLSINYHIDDLDTIELFGRFYPLRHNIRIDVGHNPLAASVIVKALDYDIVLVYNSLADKDYTKVLRILAPRIKRVEIIPVSSQRAAAPDMIEQALQYLGLPYRYFTGDINEDEHYLVFGSFFVVEEFLKSIHESK